MENKSKFDSLKRIFTILILTLMLGFVAVAQPARNNPPGGTSDKIRIYPNPAQSYITFDLQSNYEKGMSIQVFHMLGKKMFEQQNVSEKTTVNLSDYNRGVYIYHLRDGSGKLIESGKFQVSK